MMATCERKKPRNQDQLSLNLKRRAQHPLHPLSSPPSPLSPDPPIPNHRMTHLSSNQTNRILIRLTLQLPHHRRPSSSSPSSSRISHRSLTDLFPKTSFRVFFDGLTDQSKATIMKSKTQVRSRGGQDGRKVGVYSRTRARGMAGGAR